MGSGRNVMVILLVVGRAEEHSNLYRGWAACYVTEESGCPAKDGCSSPTSPSRARGGLQTGPHALGLAGMGGDATSCCRGRSISPLHAPDLVLVEQSQRCRFAE